MKNQYFGDVNDYRKYGLLRILANATGFRVGVCWMLTKADSRTDGQLRNYLERPSRWRSFDPDLYDKLATLRKGRAPAVRRARDWSLIPTAHYFDRYLRDDQTHRLRYFARAWESVRECPLVFLDPDNGIEVSSVPPGRVGSAKYVYWPEIRQGYARGHSLLLYQHYPRVAREQFFSTLFSELAQRIGAARLTAFATSRVAFLLIQQPAHAALFRQSEASIAERWNGQIDVRSATNPSFRFPGA